MQENTLAELEMPLKLQKKFKRKFTQILTKIKNLIMKRWEKSKLKLQI